MCLDVLSFKTMTITIREIILASVLCCVKMHYLKSYPLTHSTAVFDYITFLERWLGSQRKRGGEGSERFLVSSLSLQVRIDIIIIPQKRLEAPAEIRSLQGYTYTWQETICIVTGWSAPRRACQPV